MTSNPTVHSYEELARAFTSMKHFQTEVDSADDIIKKETERRTHALEQLESYREKVGPLLVTSGAVTSITGPVINMSSDIDGAEIQKIVDRGGRWDGRL